MSKVSSLASNRIMAIVVVVAGVLLTGLVPLCTSMAMDAVLKGAVLKIEATGNPALVPALKLVTFFFPFWGAMSMVAGAVLLVLTIPIYRGERWASATALGMLAIPSIGGAYMSGPVMFFAKGVFFYFVTVMLIGLVPYFIILLRGHSAKSERITNFLLFLLLGVTAAWTFSNGHSALRMFLARPEPFNFNLGLHGFALGIPASWTGVILVIVSIPFLASRNGTGWWLAAAGLTVILVGTIPLWLTHLSTIEFLAGILMAAISLTLLLTPKVGGRLAGEQITGPQIVTQPQH